MSNTTCFFVFGRPGSGKSTLLRAIVRRNAHRQDSYHKFVVFDSTREWSVPPGTLPGQVVILSPVDCTIEDAARFCLENAPCTLVVDEVDRFAPNKGGGELPGVCLPTIVYRGRHYEVAILCATQRPGKVHQSIFAHAGVVFGFNLTLAADLDRIRRELGAEEAEAIAHLDRFEYVRREF